MTQPHKQGNRQTGSSQEEGYLTVHEDHKHHKHLHLPVTTTTSTKSLYWASLQKHMEDISSQPERLRQWIRIHIITALYVPDVQIMRLQEQWPPNRPLVRASQGVQKGQWVVVCVIHHWCHPRPHIDCKMLQGPDQSKGLLLNHWVVQLILVELL